VRSPKRGNANNNVSEVSFIPLKDKDGVKETNKKIVSSLSTQLRASATPFFPVTYPTELQSSSSNNIIKNAENDKLSNSCADILTESNIDIQKSSKSTNLNQGSNKTLSENKISQSVTHNESLTADAPIKKIIDATAPASLEPFVTTIESTEIEDSHAHQSQATLLNNTQTTTPNEQISAPRLTTVNRILNQSQVDAVKRNKAKTSYPSRGNIDFVYRVDSTLINVTSR
jgi:hypothetical protein